MDQSLAKMQLLIQFLNYGQDDKYRFDDVSFKAKRHERLNVKIQEVCDKVTKVLEELLVQLQ